MGDQTTLRANNDATKYKPAPWHGKRGPAWSRFFKPAFENMLFKETDAVNSLHQSLVAQDDFGEADGPRHPAGIGIVTLYVQSTSVCAARAWKNYGFTLTHTKHEDSKDAIQDHVANALPEFETDHKHLMAWRPTTGCQVQEPTAGERRELERLARRD